MELPDLPEPVLRTLFDCETEDDWRSEHWAVWELRYGDAEHCPEWTQHKDAILRAFRRPPRGRPGGHGPVGAAR